MNKKIKNGILGIIGYLLSPLSFWNDLFLNLPIAYLFGFLISLIYRPLFFLATVMGYWLTNILGLFLLHRGLIDIVRESKIVKRKKDLIKFNLIKFLLGCFKTDK